MEGLTHANEQFVCLSLEARVLASCLPPIITWNVRVYKSHEKILVIKPIIITFFPCCDGITEGVVKMGIHVSGHLLEFYAVCWLSDATSMLHTTWTGL